MRTSPQGPIAVILAAVVLIFDSQNAVFAGACDWVRESADDSQNRGHDIALQTARVKAADAVVAAFQIVTRARVQPSGVASAAPAVPPPASALREGSTSAPRPSAAGLPRADFPGALASGAHLNLLRRYEGDPYQLALSSARRAARLNLDAGTALSGADLVDKVILALVDDRLDAQQERAVATQAALEELLPRLEETISEFKEQLNAKECLRFFHAQVSELRGANINFTGATTDIEHALQVYEPLFLWNQGARSWPMPLDRNDWIPYLSTWRDILDPIPAFHGEMISLFRGWMEDALFVRNETSYEVWYETSLSRRLGNMQGPFINLTESIPPGQSPLEALNYAEQNRQYLTDLLSRLQQLLQQEDQDAVEDEIDQIISDFGHAAVPIVFNLSFLHGYASGDVIEAEAANTAGALLNKIAQRAQRQAAAHGEAAQLEGLVGAITVPAFIRVAAP